MNYNVLKKIFPHDNCKNFYNLKYDSEGLWSISHPVHANELSRKIKLFEKTGISTNTILDTTAGIGGNTLSFANFFDKVIGVEFNKKRFNLLKNNIENYTFTNIDIYNNDFIKLFDTLVEKIDVVFIDPPWGGPGYKYDNNLIIKISDIELSDICHIISNYSYNNNKIKLIVFKLPYNFDILEIINKTKDITRLYQTIKNRNIIYLFININ